MSLPTGSTVVVQHKDRGPLTHGTIEGKGDHNHHDRLYHICITKTGRLVTQNRQHIKPTWISAEQYFCEQLQKHTKTDLLEKILMQLQKQPNANNITNNADIGPHSKNTTHDHITAYKEQDNNQRKGNKIKDKK